MMNSSLRQIRKSATLKKAEKIFEKHETKEGSPSPPRSGSETGESGIFSNASEDSRNKKWDLAQNL